MSVCVCVFVSGLYELCTQMWCSWTDVGLSGVRKFGIFFILLVSLKHEISQQKLCTLY
jgi:hypothetical protein